MSARYKCPICGKPERDDRWADLFADAPGPNMRYIGFERHNRTGLELMRQHAPDDAGVERCVTCLRVWQDRGVAILTGYELLCCGATKEDESWRPTSKGGG